MEIQIVACVADNNVIGSEGKMPWGVIHAELRRFKQITEYGIVIMGMGTYKSIGYSPLSKRINIVITSDDMSGLGDSIDRNNESILVFVNSFSDALDFAAKTADIGAKGVFVIGGQMVYEQALPYASRMHLTELYEDFDNGDRFFPEFDATQWKLVHEEDAEEDGHEMRFVEYARQNF